MLLLATSVVSADVQTNWNWEGQYKCSQFEGEFQEAIVFCSVQCSEYQDPFIFNECRTACLQAVESDCFDEPSEVPEFGTFAALGMLALVGLFVYKRRN